MLHTFFTLFIFTTKILIKQKVKFLICFLIFFAQKLDDMNIFKHVVCRNKIYANAIQRFPVPDELIAWSLPFKDYSPPTFDSPILQGKAWADPDINDASFHPNFNELDGSVNRKSHIGIYQIENKTPLNPFGRTGLSGRGILGR